MTASMINILIVDDEYLVRDLLKYCIDWGKLGYRIAGEAENVEDALHLIETHEPEVVITDICMPSRDGLELSAIIKESYPHIKIVILSGYSEFEYARSAIELGVDHYILKPINDEKLTVLFQNLRQKIESQRKENLTISERVTEERLLQLIRGQFTANEYRQIEAALFPQHDGIEVIVAEMEAGTDEHAFLENCRAAVRNEMAVYFAVDFDRRHVFISGNSAWKITEQLPFASAISVGRGTRKEKLSEAEHSYREALIALQYKIITGPGECIDYASRREWLPQPPKLTYSLDNLQFALYAKLLPRVRELIQAALLEVNLDYADALQAMRLRALQLEMVISGDAEAVHNRSEISKLSRFTEFTDYLTEIAAQKGQTAGVDERKLSDTIQSVMQHLEDHFQDEELSLSGVAAHFYLNPSYLSRTFKAESGYSFVEYLTRLRMERAKYLLSHTQLKVYEVAEEIGIKNPHYFGIMFKKYTGEPVNLYRKKFNQ
ncbi:response regulator transcription factor [Paenibacillus fonticola]|uniref:response regulator transcription factor n=1 Tax=Paenibacillus fonticola TaxID=379896 RepID=UPI00035C24EE|nr:response regulator transcription factor [Paenibacillus fonticola]